MTGEEDTERVRIGDVIGSLFWIGMLVSVLVFVEAELMEEGRNITARIVTGTPAAVWVVMAMFAMIAAASLWWAWTREDGAAASRRIEEGRRALAAEYEIRIREKDREIETIRQKLADAEGRLRKIRVLIEKAAKEKQGVREPKDMAELRDRFDRLGYPPVR